MTDAERELLMKTAEDVAALKAAFLDKPLGTPENEPSLIEGMRIVWEAYRRGSWLLRVLAFLVTAVAAVGGAVASVKGWWPWQG